MAKQTDFFGDCTSDYTPEHFFYSLSTFKNILKRFSCTYCLFFIPNQANQVYATIHIKKYLLKIFQPFDVQILHFDFDEGAHEAIKEIFSNYIVEIYRFYLPIPRLIGKRNKYRYKYVQWTDF